MKRCLWMMAFLIAAGGIVAHGISRAQVPPARPAPSDLGPGDQGATLKQPWMDAPAKPALPAANAYQQLWNPIAAPNPYGNPGQQPSTATRIALPPTSPIDMNRDIEVTKDAGPWVIFVMSYSGEQAPAMARKLVAELRSTYKLNAFVFNKGGAEKRKEFERVQALKEKQRQAIEASLRDSNLKSEVMPIRVRVMKIDEQTGVLVAGGAGGYQTRDQALDALKEFRKLKGWDPKRVDLQVLTITKVEEEQTPTGKPKEQETIRKVGFVSPFMQAFPARNPCWPTEAEQGQKFDMAFLHSINDGEPLSLLKCKKRYTLVLKQFNTQCAIKDGAKQAPGFLDQLFRKKDSVDYAAKNAATLAEALAKSGLTETYVLHTKFTSFVTTGSFDDTEGPRMTAMQSTLAGQIRATEWLRTLDMMTPPMPMLVPH